MMFVQLGVMFNNLFDYLIFVMHLYHLPLSVTALVQLHSLSPLSKFSSLHFLFLFPSPSLGASVQQLDRCRRQRLRG